VQQGWLGIAWLLLGLVANLVGAQGNPTGGVKLIETRADDHPGTNGPPRDKRFFTSSGFNGPHSFQPTVPFEALSSYNQQQNHFGGRTGSRNFANNQHFNNFNQMGGRTGFNNQNFNNYNQMIWSSPQFGSFNGRTGSRNNNMWPWGYGGDWSQRGIWPYGSWGQENWGSWGQNGQWNQFGGRSVTGPWNQFGGRSVSGPWSQFGGRSGGYWPGYGYGYGFRK
ncbi:unnamed protein product, partial [Meganyctiphanes norvegica]